MNAKDLRIGNYINYFNKAVKVNGISKNMMDATSMVGRIDGEFINGNGTVSNEPNAFDGIRLTDEWLLKFGFYSDIIFEGDSPIYTLEGNDFNIDFHTLQPIDSGFPIANYKIKYIHQLQNLYFALTGNELTILSNT